MAYYRLYFRDRVGKFLRVEEVETETDQQALDAAVALDHAHSVEVWQQHRQVGIVHPKSAEISDSEA